MNKGLERLENRRDRLRKKKRKRFIFIIAAILVLVVIFIISSSKSGIVTVTIPEGASSKKISQILKDNDIISSKTCFLLRLKLSKQGSNLRYGTFDIDKSSSFDEIIETLSKTGAIEDGITLTIPEGFSAEKIKERAVSLGLCTDAEFESALKKDYDFEFLKSVPTSSNLKYTLQGFLYPSTYEFSKNSGAEKIIQTLLNEFKKQVEPLGIPNDKLFRVLTVASVVEREAKLESERARIAGVIENRVKQDMKLQVDATVVYAVSDGLYNMDRVLYKDLEFDSPYNTYKYEGLPVGPICSPSISSIKAALTPENHEFLYYHTDTEKNDGSHIFTKEYSQHVVTQN